MRGLKTLVTLASAVLFSIFAFSTFATPAAFAQAQWPQRPVKFIVPLGPGAGVDVSARLFADRLSKIWGQPVVVENRPGGDAMVGINAFITANDDHTLLFAPSGAFTAHPYLHQKLPYDPRDLSPVARVSSTVVVVATPASINVPSLKDLIDMVRAQPGKLNWATATGLNDFLFSGFLKEAGLDMAKVPYRDTISAINDLGEGRIQVYVGALAIVRPQAQAGRVKILGVTNRARAAGAPEIPTVAEAGFPGLAFDGLTGLFGPRSMAGPARERIAADIRSVSADPEINSRLTATGQIILPGTAAEFAADIEAQRKQIAVVGAALDMKPAQ